MEPIACILSMIRKLQNDKMKLEGIFIISGEPVLGIELSPTLWCWVKSSMSGVVKSYKSHLGVRLTDLTELWRVVLICAIHPFGVM